MIEHYAPGSIPGKPFACAGVRNGSLAGRYESDWRRNTTSPLNRVELGDERYLDVRFSESWFLDLEAETCGNLDAVSSHGISRLAPDCREEINTASHWYLHPHDRPCLVVEHRYHRHPPALQEILRPYGTQGLERVSERFLKTKDGQLAVVLDGVSGATSGDALRLQSSGLRYGYLVISGDRARTLDRTPDLTARMEPDPQAAGVFFPLGEECEITLKIDAGGADHGRAEVSLYGAWQARQTTALGAGTTRLTFKGAPAMQGLQPLLVLVEGAGFLSACLFEVLVLPTVLESSDARFNGVFAEQMRSILMRRIFNVMPEDEPRGCTSYAFFFYPRNFTSYNLCGFGFPDRGFAHLDAYTEILKRDGYLAQDYDLNGMNAGELSGEPLALMNANANDGIGFYLLQLAKCLFRHPERNVDYSGVERAIRWLSQHTHWNGLLDDHSEPVTQAHSERLSGSPYSQGLCMAGLKAIAAALRARGERALAQKAQWLFRFQMEGFKKLYEPIGFIRDLQNLADPDKVPCLSDYSMPCPSLVLLDPEVDAHDLDHLYERTLRELRDDMQTPGNPWMLGKFHLGGGSYSHYGMLGSLLNLCRLEEAGGYLKEILRYSEDTRLRFILPEGVAYEDEWFRAHLPEMRARSPWVYKDSKDKEPGLPGGAVNPGCLVQLTYWLYCADLICGISAEASRIRVWPKIPQYMEWFRVRSYGTRHGTVSYLFQRRGNAIDFSLEKPEAETELVLGPLPAIRQASVNGRQTSFDVVKHGDGSFARLLLPRGKGMHDLELFSDSN